jgi:hypothetical protein
MTAEQLSQHATHLYRDAFSNRVVMVSGHAVPAFGHGFQRESTMSEGVQQLWPELDWISNRALRESVARTWEQALELSPLTADDLSTIPFTLLIPDCPASFMDHKRCVVHIARKSAEAMDAFLGASLPIDIDTVIAGAILADVGKLLEYERVDGQARQSDRGKLLRHPFTGVALAMANGVPDAVCHIIAAHAGEGDLVTRSTEAIIVHHADFMSYVPFKSLRNWESGSLRV